MSGSVAVQRLAVDALAVLEVGAWRSSVLARARAGMRPIALFGRRDAASGRVLVTAVLGGAAGTDEPAFAVSRTAVDPASGFEALTREVPAFHALERELHEQCGVALPGHPWLKPIRFAGRDQAAMASYPFYRVEGKEVHEVAVGPIHASIIEPGSFRFACYGEQVLHLEIHHGYQHRGVEARLLERDPWRLAPWVETAAGDTSIAHAWAYAAALEALAGVDVTPVTDTSRAVLLELERVAMHLGGLAGLATDLGFLPGGSAYGRLRTTAINTTMRLCGSRFGRGGVRPGACAATLDGELADLVRANLGLLYGDLALVDDCFGSARSVRHRLAGTGVLATEVAREVGVVGMAARASGIAIDARVPARGIYAELPIAACLGSGGDILARARLRIDELTASIAWLARAIDHVPAWQCGRASPVPLAPGQLAIAMVEGWRGEVVHALETGADGKLVHYKVQDPSLRNWIGLALAMRGNAISDFPICNKSFDLSYAGNDL